MVDGFHKSYYNDTLTPIESLSDAAIYDKSSRKYKPGKYVQVSKDGKYFKDYVNVTAPHEFTSLLAVSSGSAITASGSAISGNGLVKAAPAGTYLVRVYEVDTDGNAPKVLGTTTFKVKDSTAIQAVVKSSEVDKAVTNTDASELVNCIKLKIDWWKEISSGEPHDGITYSITRCKLSNTSANASAYYVASIIVTAEKNGMSIEYEVPVNRLFQKK